MISVYRGLCPLLNIPYSILHCSASSLNLSKVCQFPTSLPTLKVFCFRLLTTIDYKFIYTSQNTNGMAVMATKLTCTIYTVAHNNWIMHHLLFIVVTSAFEKCAEVSSSSADLKPHQLLKH